MNEFMKILKDRGIIDKFVKANKLTIAELRAEKGNPEYFPSEDAVGIAADIVLTTEIHRNKEIENAYAEFANDLAMKTLQKEFYKIVKENI